jgi:hypothetical protein
VDLLINQKSYKKWIRLLVIWQKIKDGEFVSHFRISAKQEIRLLAMIENYLRMRMRATENKSSAINLSVDYFHPNANIPNYIQLCFNKTTQYGNYFTINNSGLQKLISNAQLLSHLSYPKNQNQNNSFLSQFSRILKSEIYNWKISGAQFESYFSTDNKRNNAWIKCPTIYSMIIAADGNSNNNNNQSFEIRFHFELNTRKDDLLWCSIDFDDLPSAISNVRFLCGIYIPETQSEAYASAYVNQSKKYIGALHSIVSRDLLFQETQTKQEFNLKLTMVVTKHK